MKICISSFCLCFLTFAIAMSASAVLIDFEDPLPFGLTPMPYTSGTPVPSDAVLTDQYLDLGIYFDDVALVRLGTAAPSGTNGIGGINNLGNLDYSAPMTFTFYSALDGTTPAYVDYFSLTTDLWESGQQLPANTITLYAYDIAGILLDSLSYTEGGGVGGVQLGFNDIGMIHRIVIDEVYNVGGIALDLLEFNNPTPVPEPSLTLLFATGLIVLAGFRMKFRRQFCLRFVRLSKSDTKLG